MYFMSLTADATFDTTSCRKDPSEEVNPACPSHAASYTMNSTGASNSNTPTPTPPTRESTPSSSIPKGINRGKSDLAWAHCKEVPSASGRKGLLCLYCSKVLSGGGINRFKQHLAGLKGNAEACRKVPDAVRFRMQEHLVGHIMEKKRKRDMLDEQNPYAPLSEHDEEIVEMTPLHSKAKGKATQDTQSKAAPSNKMKINSYFEPRTTPGAQRTLKSVLQSKEVTEKCDLAISKWMLATSIPFNTVNSPYYQQAIDAIASMGAGYKGPGFHDLRGYLLTKNVEEVRNYVDSYRTTWKETGCTIMADGWTDQCRRTLINFLVYCPKGTIFLKSVDASDASKTGDMLYKLFREVVLFVGQENVVHFVTDNAANYVAAGRLLEQEFRTIFWSPCATHCINLILSDIGKLDEVNDIGTHASKITKYIYNHCFALNLMRKFTGGREILRPAPTRFATNFIALQSILAQQNALRAMVTSSEWTSSSHAKESKAKEFVKLLFVDSFWSECAAIVQISEPLVRVLRIVDSDERPAMGFLLEAMYKAREEMLKRFNKRKKKIEPYINILDARWDRQLHKNLHAAGYWLNPKYQYDLTEMEKNRGTVSDLLDVIERYSYGKPSLQTKLTSEMKIFKNAEGDFGRVSAVSDRIVMAPGMF
ncbi:uncharacterized protein LOC116193587 [Punica granatum]|uniref:Uncharacterized protein LOC116193587 n=1 Tax=Punica granatum TaxID=22663 RepID=A0A6P8C3U2_PUNGR|nr:uncharacterized protein LOC116193587 [Punica granatum]